MDELRAQWGVVYPFEMPHQETLYIMKQMDELRAQWGVVYPFEKLGNTGIEKIEVLSGEVEDTIPQESNLQA